MGRDAYKSIIILAALLVALVSITMLPREDRTQTEPIDAETTDSSDGTPPEEPLPTFAGSVAKNVSFFDIMTACGITPKEIKDIETQARNVYDFRRIFPGQRYELYADSCGRLETLIFTTSEEDFVEVTRNGGDLCAERKAFDFDIERSTASGVIEQSLFATLQEQSLPAELGLMLGDIFAWDIDFFTDVHRNDYFRVIYEEKTRFDGLTKIGNIVAAEFNTRGKSHYAFLFENEQGLRDYFDENGKSLRKQLLRAPLHYSRISSNFSRRRYHPVLHHYAPHLGIDYAAPTGTPVMATGAGTVMTAGYNRSNGNYVKIRHTQNYITYYLHFSRFGKGIKSGVKVEQGQVIGYVGATGYATGPHLDYRVKKNGRFVNPRTIELPPAKPVSEQRMAAFTEQREALLASLRCIPITDWRTENYADTDRPAPAGKAGSGSYESAVSHTQAAD